nr:putative gtp-binding protein [Quercus suber]
MGCMVMCADSKQGVASRSEVLRPELEFNVVSWDSRPRGAGLGAAVHDGTIEPADEMGACGLAAASRERARERGEVGGFSAAATSRSPHSPTGVDADTPPRVRSAATKMWKSEKPHIISSRSCRCRISIPLLGSLGSSSIETVPRFYASSEYHVLEPHHPFHYHPPSTLSPSLPSPMPRDPLIALVGKPSAGKSSTINALTSADAKVGNFPFTTIEPNRAIGYLHIPCPCSRTSLPGNQPPTPDEPPPLQKRCKPNYGACQQGTRSVPIELLDVAGLVPGAHQGKGLGNKFLDDLRHADALIHVVDVSGTTDAEGKSTRGYDPSQDIVWLRSEIVNWVLGNLMQKWGGVKRRHMAIKASAVDTLQGQFSGYGSNAAVVARTLDKLALKQPLQDWSDETVELVVNAFVDEKFPTVIALNKIDHPDADKNISKIAKAEKPERLVLCSAISEVFLRRLVKQNFVRYIPGSEFVDMREDLLEQGEEDGGGLKEMDDKLKTRVENLKDMVLYRFGSTGVNQVLTRASEVLGLVPVFPVRNIGTFGAGEAGVAGGEKSAVFRDCVLVKKGSTVGDVYRKVMGDAPMAYVETVGGVRVSEDDEVGVGKHDILSFKVGRA